MPIDSTDNEDNFADLLTGVKRLNTDRINIYLKKNREENPKHMRKPVTETVTDFAEINFAQIGLLNESFFDSGLQRKLRKKIRHGEFPLDDRIDLHGYTQKQTISELCGFVQHALDHGLRYILIVHGKGQRSAKNPVLKPLVQHWLAQQQTLLAWCPAQPKHGGSGATYVYLRG